MRMLIGFLAGATILLLSCANPVYPKFFGKSNVSYSANLNNSSTPVQTPGGPVYMPFKVQPGAQAVINYIDAKGSAVTLHTSLPFTVNNLPFDFDGYGNTGLSITCSFNGLASDSPPAVIELEIAIDKDSKDNVHQRIDIKAGETKSLTIAANP